MSATDTKTGSFGTLVDVLAAITRVPEASMLSSQREPADVVEEQ